EREEIARVAEGPEEDPPEPHAHGADGARLVHEVKRRVVSVEGDEAEAGEGKREDTLDLAYPATLLALDLARDAGGCRRLGGGRRRGTFLRGGGHQISRTRGVTTGLRAKRWLMERRTALPATGPIRSRSITSGSPPAGPSRAARASRPACFPSSISPSAPFT